MIFVLYRETQICSPLTGNMASAHSPWPTCSAFTSSRSLLIFTKSPTTNCCCCWASDAAPPPSTPAPPMAPATLPTTPPTAPAPPPPIDDDVPTRVNTVGLNVHRFRLWYVTTMSWSSSIPITVPRSVKHSNMPSVQPPWPTCSDCTTSKSRSTVTVSPIWKPCEPCCTTLSPKFNRWSLYTDMPFASWHTFRSAIPSKPTRYRFLAPLSHTTYAAERGLFADQSWISATLPFMLPPSWSSHCQSTPRITRAPGKMPLTVIFLFLPLRRGSIIVRSPPGFEMRQNRWRR